MSKVKMNCGYCGRKCDLDKDFCIPQDSVYVCKSCYDWQNRVADLEAKLARTQNELSAKVEYIHELVEVKDDYKQQLAEKDKAIENWQTMYQSVMQSCHNSLEEDKRLREQLVEKEKEILEVKNWWAYQYEGNTERKDQDKISFAVEQLEKVKELCIKDMTICEDYFAIAKILDNQIEELKKENINDKEKS